MYIIIKNPKIYVFVHKKLRSNFLKLKYFI